MNMSASIPTRLLHLALGTVAFLGALAIIAGILTGLSGSPFYAIIVAGPCVATILYMIRAASRRRAIRVVFHLESAMRLNAPIPHYLRVAAQNESAATGSRMRELATLLEHGQSIAVTVAGVCPELGRRQLQQIESGERSQRLVTMLQRITRPPRPEGSPYVSARAMAWYFPLLGVAIFGACTFILVFVMPKFQAILRDFKMPTPPAMRLLLAAALNVGWIVPLLIAAGLLWIGWSTMEVFWPTPADASGRLLDRITARLPVLGSVARARGSADLCWYLAGAFRAGVPLPEAAALATNLGLEGGLTPLTARWSELMHGGASPADAARNAGLPDMITCVLKTPSEGLPQTFETLGQFYDARYSRLAALVDAALIPVAAMCAGALVLLIGMAILTPITALCEAAMGFGGVR
jgi:type II secretory pathway component PulF